MVLSFVCISAPSFATECPLAAEELLTSDDELDEPQPARSIAALIKNTLSSLILFILTLLVFININFCASADKGKSTDL